MQQRVKTYWNLPERRKCFFCLKDKLCAIVKLPQNTVDSIINMATNPLMKKIHGEVAAAQYFSCEKCSKNIGLISEVLAEHMNNEYKLALQKKEER